MQKPTHDELEELFREIILPFYHIKRDICVPKADGRTENDAEHSWSLAFLACALAPKIDPELDVGLVAQLAIVQDIIDVYAGNTSAFASADEKMTKPEREAAALRMVATKFAHFPWIAAMITQYEQLDDDEAKFVYALDKYMPIMLDYLDGGQFSHAQKTTLERYRAQLATHREKAHIHPDVGKYYDEIRARVEADPDHFYAES